MVDEDRKDILEDWDEATMGRYMAGQKVELVNDDFARQMKDNFEMKRQMRQGVTEFRGVQMAQGNTTKKQSGLTPAATSSHKREINPKQTPGKKDRNKKLSINRDSKIKSVEKDRRIQGKTVEYVIQDEYDDIRK